MKNKLDEFTVLNFFEKLLNIKIEDTNANLFIYDKINSYNIIYIINIICLNQGINLLNFDKEYTYDEVNITSITKFINDNIE